MLRDILSSGLLTHFATIGLVIFVGVFAATCIWILTRSKREVTDWSHIPLTDDEDGPIQDRMS